MKLNYFDQAAADAGDGLLKLAIQQGHVPAGCLLSGEMVLGLINGGKDPCEGCNGPRERCGGRNWFGSQGNDRSQGRAGAWPAKEWERLETHYFMGVDAAPAQGK